MGQQYRCDNCGKTQYSINSLLKIADFSLRTEPGNEIPAGECPECGALCYIMKAHDSLTDATANLLEACEEMLEILDVLDGQGAILEDDGCEWSKWEKAIAKAKGGE